MSSWGDAEVPEGWTEEQEKGYQKELCKYYLATFNGPRTPIGGRWTEPTYAAIPPPQRGGKSWEEMRTSFHADNAAAWGRMNASAATAAEAALCAQAERLLAKQARAELRAKKRAEVFLRVKAWLSNLFG